MSPRSVRAPRLARKLLQTSLPDDAREHILDELDEVFACQLETMGVAHARLWYWREAVSFSARFLRERLVGAEPAARPGRAAPGSFHGGGKGGGISLLDLKLGFRMLVKNPVLTVVGGLAITVASAIGVGAAEFMRDMLAPKLPLEDGDRVVRISNAGADEKLHDFVLWRDQLESVTEVSAGTGRELGVVTSSGQTGTVRASELSASAFRLTRVAPLLGRYLTEDDEREGAPSVVVLGYQPWQALFAGDPRAIGEVVQLAGSPATVVGVMPEGYRFPSSHDAWIPLRFNPLEATPGAGHSLAVVARLADGVSLEEAKAEVEAVGRRTAADFPDTHGQLRAQIDRYGALMGSGELMVVMAFYGVRALFILLLLVACANVATLVFARTVTREAEIALRMSLGATRKRIVLQLFAEALVLVTGATLLGLLIARSALGRIANLFWSVQQEAAAPFWWDDGLSLPTVLYAGVLAFAGAVMVGVVPALKATRGVSQPRLNELSTGGGGGLPFGGIWTTVIVFQVALSVAFLPIAVEQGGMAFQRPLERSSFPAGEYVTAQLGRDLVIPPRNEEERDEAGRALQPADFAEGSRAVVVNEAFAERVLAGRNPVGGQLRYPEREGEASNVIVPSPGVSYEIVGVVKNPGVDAFGPGVHSVVYAPLSLAPVTPRAVGLVGMPQAPATQIFVRQRPGSEPLAARIYEMVVAVDPTLRVSEAGTLEDAWLPVHRYERLTGWIFMAVAGIVLMLSVAGIYALMSFTVSQRTREIAVRTAVGGAPRWIVAGVLRRALLQLSLGALVGLAIAAPVLRDSLAGGVRNLLIVAALLVGAGLASCAVPIRRALRIQPAHAMKTG